MITDPQQREERVTWLRYEFATAIERYKAREVTARELADISSSLTVTGEVEELGDELLQQVFWAMQHVLHRPACWAPTPQEIEYLLLCLREEEIFDPEQIEFTYRPQPPAPGNG
ncbi:MAG TPA: hypothetical protein VJZ27_05180 [Aggregatilineales bacterium]|nr:hypothetical protein [Aggregatilineales bacterium]